MNTPIRVRITANIGIHICWFMFRSRLNYTFIDFNVILVFIVRICDKQSSNLVSQLVYAFLVHFVSLRLVGWFPLGRGNPPAVGDFHQMRMTKRLAYCTLPASDTANNFKLCCNFIANCFVSCIITYM